MTEKLEALLEAFRKRRVLVLGDMVADEYLVGRPAKISREAPVLILHYRESFIRPGGATNTAHNLSTLGAQTLVVGVVGNDQMGTSLRDTLVQAGIETSGLVVDGNRPTSTKTRVLAKGTQEVQQQIVRIDRVDESRLTDGVRDRLIEVALDALGQVDALIISDYENGVISPEVVKACLPEARRRGLTIVVDSHGDLFRFKGVTAATPNQPEAEATVGRQAHDYKELTSIAEDLLRGMNSQGVLITQGSEGLTLFERNGVPYRLPVSLTSDSEVVDPTGAGDTVAAVFTAALASGASMREAAFLGNIAGGEVVRKVGAATLKPDELKSALRRAHLTPPV